MKEIKIEMHGEELKRGSLPDELHTAIERVLSTHNYRVKEHTWSGPDHRMVYVEKASR